MNVRPVIERVRIWYMGIRLGTLDRVTLAALVLAVVAGLVVLVWLVGGSNRIDIVNNRAVNDSTARSPFTGLPCAFPDRRPLAVMLASDPEARPLSGLTEAEVVFEIPVTPNAMTRLMAVYLCDYPEEIGSIRSARTEFLGYVGWLDAIYAHWGGERDALASLDGGILDNINALIYDGTVFTRKSGVPPPHNGFTTPEKLLEKALDLGYADSASVSFLPHRTEKASRSLASSVDGFSVSYPTGTVVTWTFNPSTDRWVRSRDGEPELDAVTSRTVNAGTVIVLETDASPVRNEYLNVRTTGDGPATVYMDGLRRTVTWRRTGDTGPLVIEDDTGNQVPIAPGPVWIMVAVPGMVIE